MNDAPRAAVTLHDVAREAGVSLATASRSLNGSTRKVAEEYRQRVLEAAARLNYTPNLSAQAVARGSTMTVALLVADISDPYFSSIAAGVAREADTEGLIVTIAMTERDSVRELELVRTMRGQRPRVMILASSRRTADPLAKALVAELEAFESNGGRVVLISTNELPFRTVLLANTEGAADLAGSLVELGYRRFAVITGSGELRTASDRLRGFRQGLTIAGAVLDERNVVEAAFTRDGGYEGMTQLIGRGIHDIDCVFAVNDVMAIGALSALRDAGFEPGVDIGVAGFDDISTARDVSPALTTVAIPLVELGRRALRKAIGDGVDNSLVPTRVVVRDSTPSRA